MTKKARRGTMQPMPWRDFVLGFQVATEALDHPRLEELPAVDPHDARSAELRRAQEKIQKEPFLRVLLAVQTHFGHGYHYHGSFVYRFWALLDLMRRGHIARWVTTSEDGRRQNFHPAVLLAAAEVKLTRNARFPVNRFLARVDQIVEEEGA